MSYKALKQTIRKYYKYTSWTQPVLTSNGTIGVSDFAITASETTSGYQPYYIMDSDTSNAWYASSSSTSSVYLTIYSKEALKLSNLNFVTFKWTSTNVSATDTISIYGSNDGTNWTTLVTNYTYTYYAKNVTSYNVAINTNNVYKYYKILNSTKTTSGSYKCWGLTQLNITAQKVTEGTSSDYDFYEDVDVYKALKQTVREYYKYKSPATGYRELTYLTSTGTQYIATDITYDSTKTYVVEGKFNLTTTSTAQLSGWDAGGAFGIMHSDGKAYDGSANYGIAISGKDVTYTQTINAGSSTQTVTSYTVDDITYSLSRSHSSLETYAGSGGLGIFACYSQTEYTYINTGTDYYRKIYADNVLVGDIIPVIRTSDSVIGMYNKVTNTFLPNSGTGTFTGGDTIIIEGTSTDYDFYIDTDTCKALRS